MDDNSEITSKCIFYDYYKAIIKCVWKWYENHNMLYKYKAVVSYLWHWEEVESRLLSKEFIGLIIIIAIIRGHIHLRSKMCFVLFLFIPSVMNNG